MESKSLIDLLDRAMQAREALFEPRHESAFRVFNGFLEGYPDLAIDLYASCLVIHDYSELPGAGETAVQQAGGWFRQRLPWLEAIILKVRNGSSFEEKRGRLVFGSSPDRRVKENGVWYAIDLCMNRDASLYLDTRNLRAWLKEKMGGKTVLNTFAYTGSLGVAAYAGGANRVIQMDQNRRFLNLAKESQTLNGFLISRRDFVVGDFWPAVSRLKRSEERFDCVILDPPFFSSTEKGVVDLASNSARLINKVRPLINDGGYLVAINNALFLSGAAYMETLNELCADGYLEVDELIPVAEDFTGYPQTRLGSPVTDPAPFNFATKIAILKVRRKAG
jgi:23S rRNA (cytosine1962-C5)-methyltransferase